MMKELDCFVAEPVIGLAEGETRWLLAMTATVQICHDFPATPRKRSSTAGSAFKAALAAS
jgi:hypothetical protein